MTDQDMERIGGFLNAIDFEEQIATTCDEKVVSAALPPGGGACWICSRMLYKEGNYGFPRGAWHYIRWVDEQGYERARHEACADPARNTREEDES